MSEISASGDDLARKNEGFKTSCSRLLLAEYGANHPDVKKTPEQQALLTTIFGSVIEGYVHMKGKGVRFDSLISTPVKDSLAAVGSVFIDIRDGKVLEIQDPRIQENRVLVARSGELLMNSVVAKDSMETALITYGGRVRSALNNLGYEIDEDPNYDYANSPNPSPFTVKERNSVHV